MISRSVQNIYEADSKKKGKPGTTMISLTYITKEGERKHITSEQEPELFKRLNVILEKHDRQQ